MRGFVLLILCVVALPVLAQESPVLPIGLDHTIYKTIPTMNLDNYPCVESTTKPSNDGEKKFENYCTTLISEMPFMMHTKQGRWQHKLFRIRKPEAIAMSVLFTDVVLPEGAKLFIYNKNKMVGPIRSTDLNGGSTFTSGFLEGNEVVVEIDMPATHEASFKISNVSAKLKADPKSNGRTPDDCYSCWEGDGKIEDAVIRIIVQLDHETRLCTGTLVNNSSRDKKPYILTAEHCIRNQFEADRAVFTFDFEKWCDGLGSVDDKNLYGAKVLLSSYEHDFTLLELYSNPPRYYNPYYAGWDVTDRGHHAVTCIHHPRAEEKHLSFAEAGLAREKDFTDRAQQSYWRVEAWDLGITEPGSSGAPLLNEENLLIGTLTGGSSQCGAPFNDYFQMLSKSWHVTDLQVSLKSLLDPISPNTLQLEGFDPCATESSCDTLSNTGDDFVSLFSIETGSGYYSGISSDSVSLFAEKFTVDDSITLSALIMDVGSINPFAAGGVLISLHKPDGKFPGDVIYQKYVPYAAFSKFSTMNVIALPDVRIIGDFFISYQIAYGPEDTFALYQSGWKNADHNTAYLRSRSGSWIPFTQISPGGKGTSLSIRIISCVDSQPSDSHLPFALMPYPNPAASSISFALPDSDDITPPKLITLFGTTYTPEPFIAGNTMIVPVNTLPPGIYFLTTSYKGKFYVARFLKK